ncbi:hypothetical protein FGRMN_8148 [Fusarium graminum]|nr:hypothetical protein FGRMN_8148 [Fusarium graminum]
MFSVAFMKEPPRGLQICTPLSNEVGAERRLFQLNIQSLGKWRKELMLERPTNREANVGQAAGDQSGCLTIANGSFEAKYTMDELLQFMPACMCDEQGIDAKMLADRVQAHLILEGKLTPTPNRDYPSDLAPAFHKMAVQEAQAKRLEKKRGESTINPSFDDILRGWKSLHGIIFSGQNPAAGSMRFPSYHPNQQAFLLRRKLTAGILVTISVKNLEACSKRELYELMREVETRGWIDMIYVTNQDEDIPWNIRNQDSKIEVINWRSAMDE